MLIIVSIYKKPIAIKSHYNSSVHVTPEVPTSTLTVIFTDVTHAKQMQLQREVELQTFAVLSYVSFIMPQGFATTGLPKPCSYCLLRSAEMNSVMSVQYCTLALHKPSISKRPIDATNISKVEVSYAHWLGHRHLQGTVAGSARASYIVN